MEGNDSNNVYSKLVASGGRGFSVRNDSDLSLVYDSGDDLEHRIAEHFPHVFNSNNWIRDEEPQATKKHSSDSWVGEPLNQS